MCFFPFFVSSRVEKKGLGFSYLILPRSFFFFGGLFFNEKEKKCFREATVFCFLFASF